MLRERKTSIKSSVVLQTQVGLKFPFKFVTLLTEKWNTLQEFLNRLYYTFRELDLQPQLAYATT